MLYPPIARANRRVIERFVPSPIRADSSTSLMQSRHFASALNLPAAAPCQTEYQNFVAPQQGHAMCHPIPIPAEEDTHHAPHDPS